MDAAPTSNRNGRRPSATLSSRASSASRHTASSNAELRKAKLAGAGLSSLISASAGTEGPVQTESGRRLSEFIFAQASSNDLNKADGLNLFAITSNAMALIAPGAFLWITFQVQSATVDTSGNCYAKDMWAGMALAVVVCLFTAAKYAELARKYPNAGDGGAYAFAIVCCDETNLKWLRSWKYEVKMFVGWAAHLYYWVYPGVMIACLCNLLEYIIVQLLAPGPTLHYEQTAWNTTGIIYKPTEGMETLSPMWKVIFAGAASSGVGYVVSKGISGSTLTAAIINFVQLSMLGFTSCLFIYFRLTDPLGVGRDLSKMDWDYTSLFDVVMPHSAMGVLYQASVAILILVGFDSATSQAGSAQQPSKDVPRAVMLSLAIQGFIAYFFEYAAADLAFGSFYTQDGGKVRGLAAAAVSGAPIGDLTQIVGDQVLGKGTGKLLMLCQAGSVAMAVFGSALAATATAIRFTEAMADGNNGPAEIPSLFARPNAAGMPQFSLACVSVASFLLGSVGCIGGATTLLAVSTASNVGTFLLYAVVCALCYVSYVGTPEFNWKKHVLLPLIGFFLNLLMLASILGIGWAAGGAAREAVKITGIITISFTILAWFCVTDLGVVRDARIKFFEDMSSDAESAGALSDVDTDDEERAMKPGTARNLQRQMLGERQPPQCQLVCQYGDLFKFDTVMEFGCAG